MKCIYKNDCECEQSQECFKVIGAENLDQLMKNVNMALYMPYNASKGVDKSARYELAGVMVYAAGGGFFQPIRCIRATAVRG